MEGNGRARSPSSIPGALGGVPRLVRTLFRKCRETGSDRFPGRGPMRLSARQDQVVTAHDNVVPTFVAKRVDGQGEAAAGIVRAGRPVESEVELKQGIVHV